MFLADLYGYIRCIQWLDRCVLFRRGIFAIFIWLKEPLDNLLSHLFPALFSLLVKIEK